MAPINFDENMNKLKILLKEQLLNTAIFYDYLCSNFIDLAEVEKNAQTLYKHLLDLKQMILYAFDLNPENEEL